jgi:hypothetical protein
VRITGKVDEAARGAWECDSMMRSASVLPNTIGGDNLHRDPRYQTYQPASPGVAVITSKGRCKSPICKAYWLLADLVLVSMCVCVLACLYNRGC